MRSTEVHLARVGEAPEAPVGRPLRSTPASTITRPSADSRTTRLRCRLNSRRRAARGDRAVAAPRPRRMLDEGLAMRATVRGARTFRHVPRALDREPRSGAVRRFSTSVSPGEAGAYHRRRSRPVVPGDERTRPTRLAHREVECSQRPENGHRAAAEGRVLARVPTPASTPARDSAWGGRSSRSAFPRPPGQGRVGRQRQGLGAIRRAPERRREGAREPRTPRPPPPPATRDSPSPRRRRVVDVDRSGRRTLTVQPPGTVPRRKCSHPSASPQPFPRRRIAKPRRRRADRCGDRTRWSTNGVGILPQMPRSSCVAPL